MTKHTPGPWKAEPIQRGTYSRNVGGFAREEMDYSWRIDPVEVYSEKCHGGIRPPHFTVARVPPDSCNHAEANARLIAAAPDLLAALESAPEPPQSWSRSTLTKNKRLYLRWYHEARAAAIAKARP